MAFDLNDHDAHIGVDQNDVGLMILISAAHAYVGNDKPVAEERASEAIDNGALGLVPQQLHWKIFRDELSHIRLFRLAALDECATVLTLSAPVQSRKSLSAMRVLLQLLTSF